MRKFDYIFSGGGAAGLALAYTMITNGLADRSMLIIDRESKVRNDRTWCFWADHPTLFNEIISHRWSGISLYNNHCETHIDLAPYHYCLIRGIDFYRFTIEALRQQPGVEFLNGTIGSIEDGAEQAQVVIDGQRYGAQWVFDSRIDPQKFVIDANDYTFLWQHFRGWVIETAEDFFDPRYATLFDFRLPQRESTQFIYLLPFSPRRGLVEYTLFSSQRLTAEEYEQQLRDYLHLQLRGKEYRIIETEEGAIPMTDRPFSRHGGQRIVNIGTKGGRVKPSTGFAFERICRDSLAIVASLRQQGHPFHDQHPPRRYATFDAMMLWVLKHRGNTGASLLTHMFRRNPIARVWRFLDEKDSLIGNIKLMLTVARGSLFVAYIALKLRALLRLMAGRRARQR